MELSSDLIAIQGVLSSVTKNTGEFTKINYRGGNESKILQVMMEIQKYLASKSYLKDGKINSVFDKQLEDIVFFLAINTTYKQSLELEEYSHLMGIVPPLSKCVLVNIVYGLDLCKYYCTAIEKLPIEISSELLDEAIPCLKKSIPKIHLEYARMFLKAAAIKLESLDYSAKIEDDIDNICEVTNIMLQNLTGLYADQTKHMNASQIYQHMGYCLMHLFDLLLSCDINCITLRKFIGNVIRACCSIVRNVTINVYCVWAEIQVEEEVLQGVISGKAYLIIQAYHKNSEASELIGMLGSIARKPPSLTELIQKADVTTIINKINKKDQDQKSWFHALLNNQVLKNKEAIKCINRWAHLCNEEDVILLLNLCIQTSNMESRKLVVKCASTLDLEKLQLVCIRYFYRNKFSNILNDNIEPTLMLIFNKLNENTSLREDLVREMNLLLLQNPISVFRYIYSECLKNTYYTDCLVDTFINIQEISKIDSIGVVTLNDVINENRINSQNINSCAYLLKKLTEVGYLTKEVVLLKVFSPLLEKCHSEKYLEELDCILQIILAANITIPVRSETRVILETCLDIMRAYRCRFLNFTGLNQDIVKHVVDIFMDLCEVNVNLPCEVLDVPHEDDRFLTYYKKHLSSDMNTSFFKSLFPEFLIDNYGECVSRILQVLPSAVTREWLNIIDEVVKEYGMEKCMELLTDVMILLSQLVETQNLEINQSIYLALKYCIQNFGLVVQQRIQGNSELHEEMNVTRQVCRLIAKLPDPLKEEEGFSLINILTHRSLKSLAVDKEFLCLLILIKNKNICKTLAEKIKT